MSVKKVVAVLVFILTLAEFVQAMVVPGRWEKVAVQKPGTKIVVTLMTGDRLECALVDLTAGALVVSTPDGVQREYDKDNVVRITTADKRHDSLVNGTLIGVVVAAIPTVIVAAACLGGHTCTGEQVGAALPVILGIGAGAGLAADAAVKNYETLYVAPKNEPKS